MNLPWVFSVSIADFAVGVIFSQVIDVNGFEINRGIISENRGHADVVNSVLEGEGFDQSGGILLLQLCNDFVLTSQ